MKRRTPPLSPTLVIPAKAGTQSVARNLRADWVPTFAGMTRFGCCVRER